MKRLLLHIILNSTFLILNPFCFAQQHKIDSLLTLLRTDKADTNKLFHLNKLSDVYDDKGNYDSALFYANSALKLCATISKESSDPAIKLAAKRNEALSYNYIGNVYSEKDNYMEALKNYSAALKIREVLNDKKEIAHSHNCIGFIYEELGNYAEALKNHFAALKINETIDDKKGVADSYNDIGNVYKDQSNYTEALKNHLASLKIKESINDKMGIAYSYNNIGLAYEGLGNFSEALKNLLASLKIKEAVGNKRGIASSCNNIGLVYYRQGNYSEALNKYFASLKIYEDIGDKGGISLSYNNIANVLRSQKNYKLAEEYLIKAKALAKEIGYKEYLRYAYKTSTALDSAKGNYKGAYENHKLYILYRDSIDNDETRGKTIQTQLTYDFEKKEAVENTEHKKELENQQMLAEEKSRKQKIILFFVLGSLLLVLFFAGFIFRSLRITRKQKHIIELQKTRVEEQKQEVEHQKLLVEEHQKEIIDSITYAKRLQQAILPSDEEIKKYLPDSFILYKPKDIVAGDFYWMHISPKEDLVFIAAADSTGHGVPGAMVSVVCSNALNRAVNEFHLMDTGKILDKTRELVLETFAKSGEEIKDGMDISLLSINKEKKQINWSGANNQLWYFQNNNLIEIKPDKQAIGKTDNPQSFTTHVIELKSGDTYYLMTDGYADQFGGEKGKKYKYKQLQEKLIATYNLPLAEQKEKLTTSFDNWKGNLEQVDDVTIIGIRI